ncbi:tetratricopeptide repeat protein [Nonomuraea jiangxiensis]|uniref:Tetratricopeptide repeat-containing protein n=1 Tax=Nonomuraea jiangxiensis TaxID=633440 RepID=A0A1G8JNB8_9ACTN|nr:tetratricopeptide repeat protein [Nonomuraea jiangxiensis]SDI32581.1 Tetratricopeptide repeat-containing protein [Nonomuraea jiangxiensis]
MSGSPTSLDIAFGLLQEGRLVDAEQVLSRELRAAEQSHGHGSAEWASAQCDLGNLLFSSGQLDRAVHHYRSACANPPAGDRERYRDHLTYRLNLGTALAAASRYDEAETELRHNLLERQEFYGREHPGYAFALEPLADVLLRRGHLDQARQAIEETIGIFWHSGHERVATALALRAEIVLAQGGDEPVFPGLEELPDEVVAQMGFAVTGRTGDDPAATKVLLTLLVTVMETRFGPDHPATLNALSHLANTSHDAGDEPGRVAAITKVLASYDRQGRTEDAVKATLGLAQALEGAGDLEGSLRTYAQARARADGIGRPELSAQVLRNWGLALSDAGRPDQAEPPLREAVAEAGRGSVPEMLGRSHVALGLFLQHQERLADARSAVEAGLSLLDVAHPDAITGRSHLGAIMEGRSCGCGNVKDAVAAAFREFVIGRLPRDLLEELEVTIENDDFALQVKLCREPTEAELERLDALVQSATAEFRGRLTAR